MFHDDDILNISIVQMTSVDDVEKNFKSIMSQLSIIAQHKKVGQHLVCLPENALYMRIQESDDIPYFDIQHSVFQELQAWVDQHNIHLHIGSVPLALKSESYLKYNSSVFLKPGSLPEDSYQKIHLFDIQLDGQKPIQESDAFQHGSGPQIIQIGTWTLGQSICYDLRFSNLFLHYAQKEVDVILIPAAFLPQTGAAHWEILCRARAIESQVYVVAAAQAGIHFSSRFSGVSRRTFGHSMVIHPWGNILSQGSSEQCEILQLTLHRSELKKVRMQIPMKNHRRLC